MMGSQRSNSSDEPVSAHRVREVLLDSQGNPIGNAISAQHREALLESNRRLQKLYELSRDVCAARERTHVLRVSAEAVVQLTGAERCFILTGGSVEELRPAVGHPGPLFSPDGDWPISRTIVGRVFETCQSLLTSDALSDLKDVASVSAHQIRSVLCVPIGPPGLLVGVIYADNREEVGIFTELDLRFLTALSQFIYLAYRNVRELEETTVQLQLSDARWDMYQDELFRQHQIVGRSQVMLQAYERLRLAARKNVPILLLGETGTGKELFAEAAHQLSPRRGSPYITINVAALSVELIASELFGHVKGAFTGAAKDRKGKLELADGGSLFLDEVGETPVEIQAKLLRVLDTGTFDRVGDEQVNHADFRLICATNCNLLERIEKGLFREDLYYRIAGVIIELPPLRRHADDIPDLVHHILCSIGSDKKFTDSAIERLRAYSWPGNVRQLYRVVQELDAVCPSVVIAEADLPVYFRCHAGLASARERFLTLDEHVEQAEREHFRRAYELAGSKDQRAMQILDLKRTKYFEKKRRFLSKT